MILFALIGVAFPIIVTPAFDSDEVLEEATVFYNELQSFISPFVNEWKIDEIMIIGPYDYSTGIADTIEKCLPNANVNVFVQEEE